MAARLLLSLLRGGKKAVRIAQECRREKTLFNILIQEKSWADFKTLADVFIQQVVKAELESQFPGIGQRVYGEENNQFTNTLGETITVELKNTLEETSQLLSKVLDGNKKAAELMAECAHNNTNDFHLEESYISQLQECNLDINEVGIWIDPIDATSQYVKGTEDSLSNEHGIYLHGLQCVTVLIGAYHITTGLPIMGVIFQPFYKMDANSIWESRCIWGVCYNNVRISNMESTKKENQSKRKNQQSYVVVASANDSKAGLISSHPSVELCTARGAGYKCLCVIDGLADAFPCFVDKCYKWDTCAPHALLLSLGGGTICIRDATKGSLKDLSKYQVRYNKPNVAPLAQWCNAGGFIAYSDSERSAACLGILLETPKE